LKKDAAGIQNMVQTPFVAKFKRVAENLFIRGSRYYGIIKKNQVKIRQSLKTDIRDIANARLVNVKADLKVANVAPKKKDLPLFSQAIKETIEAHKNDGNRPRSHDDMFIHKRINKGTYVNKRVADNF
jgi:hypothetical protein